MRGRLALLDLLESSLYVSPPDAARRLHIDNAQRVLRYPTFVETGTYRGGTTAYAARLFEQVHSIELDPALARGARERFAGDSRITVHEGNSAAVLRALLPTLSTSCLFWLDAHYSGGVTARGDSDCPLVQELEAIAALAVKPCALLIDDVQLFGTDPAYPTLETAITALRRIDPAFHIGVAVNMLWAAPEPLLRFRWETKNGVVEIGR